MARALRILLAFVLLYIALGTAFHCAWKGAQVACRQARAARGEFVEPEVFGGIVGWAFVVAYWPVYIWANMYHTGTPLATPCTR